MVHANGNPSWELLRALRLEGASASERREKACLALDGRMMSVASERAALTALREACAAALAALPTSLSEDEELLADGDAVVDCMRVALEWRAGYKRTLAAAVRICSAALGALL